MSKVFIIAEFGINPNGSMDITTQPSDVAVQPGCDKGYSGDEVGSFVSYAAPRSGRE
jgi:hypothetical protein